MSKKATAAAATLTAPPVDEPTPVPAAPKTRAYEGTKIVRVRFVRQVEVANEYREFISERNPGFHLDLRGPLLWVRFSRKGAADDVVVVPITTILWMKAAEGE